MSFYSYICPTILKTMTLTLKKELKDISRSELLFLNKQIIKVLKKLFGKKKNIKVRTTARGSKSSYGCYSPCENTIYINRNTCLNIDRYVSTLIHEWRHSRQKGLKKNYLPLERMYGYMNNPYEVDARMYEKKYRPLVWKMVKEKLK